MGADPLERWAALIIRRQELRDEIAEVERMLDAQMASVLAAGAAPPHPGCDCELPVPGRGMRIG